MPKVNIHNLLLIKLRFTQLVKGKPGNSRPEENCIRNRTILV